MGDYKKAWTYLNDITPLDSDCGNLCNGVCCNGNEKDGMLLFPGEEFMYKDLDEDWFNIINTDIKIGDEYYLKLFVCKGLCNRDLRPLACRIFPLMPYVNKDSELDLVFDLRLAYKCPLIKNSEKYPLAENFINDVYEAILTVIEYDNVEEYINFLSIHYNELTKMWNDFT